jgi:hypothetical protein
MKKQKRILSKFILLFLLLAAGCEKEIPIASTKFKPQLVINCILDTDTSLSVYVSKTSLMADTSNSLVNNAVVGLWEDKIFLENLSYAGNGLYQYSGKPLPGRNYRLKLNAPGFTETLASDTIPNPVTISDAYYKFHYHDVINQETNADMFVEFVDPPETKNYYELIFYTISKSYSNNLLDTVEYINYYNEFTTDDPILKAEGDLNYKPVSIFFSDELFDGRSVKIATNILTYGGGCYYGVCDFDMKASKIAELRSISSSYYQYRKKWTRHLYNQGINLNVQDSEELRNFLFTGEPVNMYTNVQNGYGIFAGYSKCPFVMRRID